MPKWPISRKPVPFPLVIWALVVLLLGERLLTAGVVIATSASTVGKNLGILISYAVDPG